jgi:hypothetical protein
MKKLSIAVLVDIMGSSHGTPEEEYWQHRKHFTRMWPGCSVYQAMNLSSNSSHGIKPGTDVIAYDYGGMLPGCGDLLDSNVRELIHWAQEHPAGLVLVVSSFTWEQQIAYELKEQGLNLPNIIHMTDDEDIPSWFVQPAPEKPKVAIKARTTLKRPGRKA